MKQLLIIRHAKSSWDLSTIKDFDRPLNQRGHKDAPAVAQELIHKKIQIDLFISSTANRAITTAEYFAKAFNIPSAHIEKADDLYHAPPPIFIRHIQKISNQINTVAIFAHNPGITQFVNQLSLTQIDNMPTCGVFAVKCDIKNWNEFSPQRQYLFWFFTAPKLL